MGSRNGISLAIFFTLMFIIIKAENNVPVYIWNIDTDVRINPLQKLTSEDLVGKLSLSLDRKLIVVFLQDELSVEDFKSGDLNEVRELGETMNDGILYAPSVANTEKLPEILEAAGFKLIRFKSSEDLPKSEIKDNMVLVVDLPATELGSSRNENLQLNGDIIREVYDVLKSKQQDLIAVFTAKRNSRLVLDESRRRITRSTVADEVYMNDFLNTSVPNANSTATDTAFLFFETAPVLKIGSIDSSGSGKVIWGNFTLNKSPDTTLEKDGTYSRILLLKYSGPFMDDSTNSELASADITLNLTLYQGYWSLWKASIDFTAKINSTTPFTKNLPLLATDISTPYGSSYHCTPTMRLASLGLTNNLTYPEGISNDPNVKLSFETNGFQLQPFNIRNNKFGDWYDCQGFFTEGIWAAILVGLVLAMMLAWAVSMVDDIKSPDRFDDPKGKTITVNATE